MNAQQPVDLFADDDAMDLDAARGPARGPVRCPNCGRPRRPEAAECPYCGIVYTRFRRRSPAPASAVPARAAGTADSFSLADLPWRGLFVAGIVAAVLFWQMKPVYVPVDGLKRSGGAAGTPCEGQSRCVVAYVAPWCPACARSKGVIDAVRERFADDPEVGVVVVVGQDTEVKMGNMAAQYGDAGWIDADGRFAAAADIDVVPSWFVLGPGGEVQAEQVGTYMMVGAQLDALGLAPGS
jgi:hypothetical protein